MATVRSGAAPVTGCGRSCGRRRLSPNCRLSDRLQRSQPVMQGRCAGTKACDCPRRSSWRDQSRGERGMMALRIGRARLDRRDGCCARSWCWTAQRTCAGRWPAPTPAASGLLGRQGRAAFQAVDAAAVHSQRPDSGHARRPASFLPAHGKCRRPAPVTARRHRRPPGPYGRRRDVPTASRFRRRASPGRRLGHHGC